MPSEPRWISVGRIVRAHGIRGELGVRCDDPQTSALLSVREVRLEGESALRKVTGARTAHIEVLLRLEGVNDRTAAEQLKGRDVEIPRESLPEPEEGEVYLADLAGLQAFDESGKPLGEVKGLWETGPVPVLVIGEGQDELLVPFAEQFVLELDVEGGRVVIRPPEYVE